MKQQPIVTRESLQQMIDTSQPEKVKEIVGRALVVLFDRQTQDEKATADTKHDNGVGFASSDAKSGTIHAKYFLANKTLQDWMVFKWTKKGKGGFARITKYARQLNERAEEKARRAATKEANNGQ